MQIIGRGARLVRIAFVVAAIGAALLSARLAQTTGSPEAAQFAIASALLAGVLVLARRSVAVLARGAAARVTPDLLQQAATSAAVSGTCAALAGYVAAWVLLTDGSTADGWAALLLANRIAAATAIVSVVTQCLLVAVGAGRIRERASALLLLAATTAVPVAALVLLGTTLSGSAGGDRAQAIASAMRVAGQELVILPAIFALAAAALPVVRRTRATAPALAIA